MTRLPTITIAAFLAAAAATAQAAGVTVYSNDFSTQPGSEWTSNAIAPGAGGESYLATSIYGSGASTNTLTLGGLAAHSSITVSFDLYIIQSMDGNGPYGGGPDVWKLDANGVNLLTTTFANFSGDTQSYSAATPNGLGYTNAPYSGAFATNHLGFGTGDYGDATYRLSYTFASTAANLAIAFTSLQTQGPGDEGWGLDNVSVTSDATSMPPVAAVPEPANAMLLLVGFGAIGFVLRRR